MEEGEGYKLYCYVTEIKKMINKIFRRFKKWNVLFMNLS